MISKIIQWDSLTIPKYNKNDNRCWIISQCLDVKQDVGPWKDKIFKVADNDWVPIKKLIPQ
jgi:hypothetical protein